MCYEIVWLKCLVSPVCNCNQSVCSSVFSSPSSPSPVWLAGISWLPVALLQPSPAWSSLPQSRHSPGRRLPQLPPPPPASPPTPTPTGPITSSRIQQAGQRIQYARPGTWQEDVLEVLEVVKAVEVEVVEVGISGHSTHCGGPQLSQLGSGRCRVAASGS